MSPTESAFAAVAILLLLPFTALPLLAAVWLALSLNRRKPPRFVFVHGYKCDCKECKQTKHHESLRRAANEQ
jgi:hypothetical protein